MQYKQLTNQFTFDKVEDLLAYLYRQMPIYQSRNEFFYNEPRYHDEVEEYKFIKSLLYKNKHLLNILDAKVYQDTKETAISGIDRVLDDFEHNYNSCREKERLYYAVQFAIDFISTWGKVDFKAVTTSGYAWDGLVREFDRTEKR